MKENTQHHSSTADLPPARPMMEVDEASGRRMVKEAQGAVHVLSRAFTEIGKLLRDGTHPEDMVKLGFDFDMSQAYVEIDMESLYLHVVEMKLCPQGLGEIFDNMTVTAGHYVDQSVDADMMPRMLFTSTPTSTVRLYLHSLGR